MRNPASTTFLDSNFNKPNSKDEAATPVCFISDLGSLEYGWVSALADFFQILAAVPSIRKKGSDLKFGLSCGTYFLKNSFN